MTQPHDHAPVSEPPDMIEGAYHPAKARPPSGIVLRNEFAKVEVEPLDVPGGSVLLIRDLRNGQTIVLDPLELESLTRMQHADFGDLVNPSREPSTNGSGGSRKA